MNIEENNKCKRNGKKEEILLSCIIQNNQHLFQLNLGNVCHIAWDNFILLGESFSFPYQLQVLTASMLCLGAIDYGHPYVDLNSVVWWDYQSQIRKGKEELEIEWHLWSGPLCTPSKRRQLFISIKRSSFPVIVVNCNQSPYLVIVFCIVIIVYHS